MLLCNLFFLLNTQCFKLPDSFVHVITFGPYSRAHPLHCSNGIQVSALPGVPARRGRLGPACTGHHHSRAASWVYSSVLSFFFTCAMVCGRPVGHHRFPTVQNKRRARGNRDCWRRCQTSSIPSQTELAGSRSHHSASDSNIVYILSLTPCHFSTMYF